MKKLILLILFVPFISFGQTAEEYVFTALEKEKEELDFSGAKFDYSRAIELDPNYFKAWNSRAVLKMRMEDYYGAIADFTKAIELDPNHEGSKRGKALCKYRLGDDKGALTDFNEIIKLSSSKNAFDYLYRGRAKSGMEDDKGAIADYSKVIGINPNDAVAYYNRGLSKYYLGDYYGACKDARKAQELGYYASAFIEATCN